MKKYRFFFHYNKIASKKLGIPVMTIHQKGKCYIAHTLNCFVPVSSKTNKSQPYLVMQGFGIVRRGKTPNNIIII